MVRTNVELFDDLEPKYRVERRTKYADITLLAARTAEYKIY